MIGWYFIQGSQSEPLRRVRAALRTAPSFPHACASFNSVGVFLPPEFKGIEVEKMDNKETNKPADLRDADLIWEPVSVEHVIKDKWIDLRKVEYRFPN